MSSSNCCFLTCIQISQEAGQMVWYFHLFQNFPYFIVIHRFKGFGIVNKAEIDVILEVPHFFDNSKMLAIWSLVPLSFLFFFMVHTFFFFLVFFFKFYFIFKLFNIVLVLPIIKMNPWQVYMCSPSPSLPPPSPYHPSGFSKCTSPKHPVSGIEPGLATRFIHDIIHVSMPFCQIFPPSPSPTESKRLFYTSVSLLLSRTQGYCYHISKFHIYALVYCIGVFPSGLLHSV